MAAPRRTGVAPMGRLIALLACCHPGPCVAVTAMTTALGAAAGLGPLRCVGLAAAILTGQLAIGWTNDALDAAADRQTARSDKPIAAGRITARAVAVAAIAAGVACVPLSLVLGWRAGVVHLVAVAGGLGYDLVLKRTVLSFLPYAVSFGLLPAVVSLQLAGHPWPPATVLAAGALIGVGAHLADAMPDLDIDRAAGVRGFPHRIGRSASAAVSAAALLVATALLAVQVRSEAPAAAIAGAIVAVSVTAAGAAAAARAPAGRAAFTAVVLVAAVDVVLLIVAGSTLG
jgi:4-hydroxybenzoate polyprenyltransferase